MDYIFILRKVGDDANEAVGIFSPLLAALVVNAKSMVHDIPLWFLAALFLVENLYYLLYKNEKYNVVVSLILFVLAFLNTTFNKSRLPFCIDIALVALLFYHFGSVLRKYGDKIFKPYLFVLSTAVVIAVFIFNGKVAMHTNCYNNLFLFVAGGAAGCYSMAYLSKKMYDLFGERKLVQAVARNTLIICALHLIVFAGLKGVMLYVFKVEPSILTGTFFPNVIFALISMVICLIICEVKDRWVKTRLYSVTR